MSNKYIDVGDMENTFSYLIYNNGRGTNSASRKRMKKFLQCALENEITDTQREYLLEYYKNGKSMKEIAEQRNLHKSTVSRTISRAMVKLKHIAQYYSF